MLVSSITVTVEDVNWKVRTDIREKREKTLTKEVRGEYSCIKRISVLLSGRRNRVWEMDIWKQSPDAGGVKCQN